MAKQILLHEIQFLPVNKKCLFISITTTKFHLKKYLLSYSTEYFSVRYVGFSIYKFYTRFNKRSNQNKIWNLKVYCANELIDQKSIKCVLDVMEYTYLVKTSG